MDNIFKVILFAAALCMTSSCFVGDEALENQNVFDLGSLESSCELNTDRLEFILDEDVSKEIACLEINLQQFADFVRLENPNYISRPELAKFIDKFFPDKSELAKDLLKLVFDLNSLLLKDPRDKIAVRKLRTMFKLFYIVNREGRALNGFLKGSDNKSYWNNRRQIYTALEELASKAMEVISDVQGPGTKINVMDFMKELKDILKLTDDQFDLDLIESFLFVKKLVLGGEPEVVTSEQFRDLLGKASELGLIALDLINVPGKTFETSTQEKFFYYDIIRDISSFYYNHKDSTVIIKHEDLVTVADKILNSEDTKIANMEDSIRKVKPKLIGGEEDKWTFKDVLKITDWGIHLMGMMYFNEITFAHHTEALSSPNPIQGIRKPDLEEYHVFSKDKLKELWSQFEFITLNYRFFSDRDGLNHYFTQYRRFSSGFNKVALFRWLIKKMIDIYGHYPVNGRDKEVNVENVAAFLKDAESAFRELGLWPRFFDRFVDELVNGSDLFQFQGDGNGTADVEEVTEYVLTIFHAEKISSKIYDHLQNYCKLTGDDGESFDIPCYREYFLHIFMKELEMDNYFDRLKDYFRLNGMEEAQQYLINLEIYSREIPDESLPMTRVDLTRLVIAFSNLEAAFIRFDGNKDGILDRGELDRAFDVFKLLIRRFGGDQLQDADEKLVRSVFLYLVREMQIPSTWDLIKFHLFGNKKDITATRFNIAAILSFFVQQ